MDYDHPPTPETLVRRAPWNKGRIVGAKPPLRPSHVWSIRTKLQMQGRQRDLALFNLAIDSKLRGCDVVANLRRYATYPEMLNTVEGQRSFATNRAGSRQPCG